MFEREDSPDPLRELTSVLRRLASAGSGQPALFPDENLSAGQLVRTFDQRASAVRESLNGRLSASQIEALTLLEQKLAAIARDGAEFDADVWTDAAVRTSEHWSEVRRLASEAVGLFDESPE